jgi:hypothetical protein
VWTWVLVFFEIRCFIFNHESYDDWHLCFRLQARQFDYLQHSSRTQSSLCKFW